MRISDWSSDVCSSDLDEVLLALAFLREAIVVRTTGVNDVRDRNVEVGLHVGHRGQAGGGDGDAVIALDAADDLLLLRPAQRVVVVPHHLDRGVVGLGAGVGEEHRSEEHTSELQSLMRISSAVFCLKKKK